jgi:hypothetical protein
MGINASEQIEASVFKAKEDERPLRYSCAKLQSVKCQKSLMFFLDFTEISFHQ